MFRNVPFQPYRLCTILAALLLSVSAFAASTVTVAGTGTSQNLLQDLARAFMASHPDIRIEVPDSIGSGGGVRAAGEGKVDIGRVARKIKKKEEAYGLAYLPFARLPIVFVSHPAVHEPRNLTAQQSVNIFSGHLDNWTALGGPVAPIRVIHRYEGDSTIKLLRKTVPGWQSLSVPVYSKKTKKDGENARIINEVPGAIGYSNPILAKAFRLNVLSLDGVGPDSPDYPVQIELGLVYKPETLQPAAKDFLDYLATSEGRKQLRAAGALPIEP